MNAAVTTLRFRQQANHVRSGMALVITLSAVVLLTVLILAFFSRSLLNRQIAFSGTNQIKADIMARTALDIVVGEMREEIRDGSYSTSLNGGSSSYPTIYQPKTTTDLLPRQSSASLPVASGAAYIVKNSAQNTGINPSSSGRKLGSSVRIDDRSLNGRALSASKWFQSGSPKLGTSSLDSSALPTWVFLTHGNSVTTAPIITAKTTSNDYVIGRFAYTIYDISGMLNANVSGFPTIASSSQPLKSSGAYADMDIVESGLNANLTGWRNTITGATIDTFNEWCTGVPRSSGAVNKAALAVARGGHVSAVVGDNAIISRRDLIQNEVTASVANYLTHFSLCLNQPSWSPQNPPDNPDGSTSSIDYKSQAETAGVSNRNLPNVRFLGFTGTKDITHYADDGTTRTVTVYLGDSLIQQRFSLAKLAWLGPDGPNVSAFASTTSATQRESAIQSCFGLRWVSGSGRWEYVGASGTTVQQVIKTLDVVATEGREPNFFELLKAGILSGSLGQYSGEQTPMSGYASGGKSVQPILEKVKDLQILKIGANIIDSADNDNYPTIIYFEPGGMGIEMAGTENLPYFYGVDTALLEDNTTTTKMVNQADLIWTPILFNPHRTSPISSGSGPANVTVSILRGSVISMNLLNVSGSTLSPNKSVAGQSFSVSGSGFVDQPNAGLNSNDAQSLGKLVPYATGNKDALCFRIFSYATDAAGVLPKAYTAAPNVRYQVSDLLVALQYVTPGGKTKIYATFGGYDDGTGLKPDMGLVYSDCNTAGMGLNQKSLQPSYFSVLWDPRTVRLGPSQGWSRSSANLPPDPTTDRVRNRDPFGWADVSASLYFEQWPQGGKSGGQVESSSATPQNYLNMKDPDGIVRPADGWLGDAANLYRNLGDTARRFVILQRPYRNVAELGYVFRDNPWKTLSFFDETSADSALLDLFSISDEPAVTAGKVQLNSRSAPIIQSLLSKTAQNPEGTTPLTGVDTITTAYETFTFNSGSPTATMPINISGVPTFVSKQQTTLDGVSIDKIKYHREAIVRSLAGTSQTRTWNLLVDLVAQVGRYPVTAGAAKDFVVDGEKRYWLSVAIDRFTGQVVGQQLELVNE